MDSRSQAQFAQDFRELHDRYRVLVLPNAWDAGSAGVLAGLGFPALATTSGGVAWSLGYADGEQLPLDELLASVRRIVKTVHVPVSVDFEGGFGATPDAVGRSVRAVIEAGASGINLEDGLAHERLRDLPESAARIAAARKAAEASGVPLFINARIDTWITGFGSNDEDRVAETLRRAKAYLDAGADGIYPIALAEPDLIETLCAAIPAPVNIGARPGLPEVAELARLGVARVSTATRLPTLAYAAARSAASHLRDTGRFDRLAADLSYDELQHLFPTRPKEAP